MILGCSTSFVHAHKGKKGSAHALWINLREQKPNGWIENIGQKYKWGPKKNHRTRGYKWNTFKNHIKLQRGDKVWLGEKKPSGKLLMAHPSTAITDGAGGVAKTYSADNLSHKFIHQTVGWYYANIKQVPVLDRRVWVLQPTKN